MNNTYDHQSWPNNAPWQGHWHGFGPWVGDGKSYANEAVRRPADLSGAHVEFIQSRVPPLMTGLWLMRPAQAVRERTWTHVGDAIAWLTDTYKQHPPLESPDGATAYVGHEVKTAYARDALPRGVDVVWAYWLRGQTIASYAVVCCPNFFHKSLPCPCPPN
ncbi:hypothetical protein RCO28_01645 [Streptomyces sp. LHD-70]|uniref:hypothetical protein n=1 Tax=Streptomyces sp. LHD-70 TaxID=3072140 RepID=UPI00280EEEDA|nr:hypothetical protein [Streptomyces sp. LHD-70]MDQ8701191.1 hypothetical protein [Streptomyces sp. LHD-70]